MEEKNGNKEKSQEENFKKEDFKKEEEIGFFKAQFAKPWALSRGFCFS